MTIKICSSCGKEFQQFNTGQKWCPDCEHGELHDMWAQQRSEHAEEHRKAMNKSVAKCSRKLGYIELNEHVDGYEAHHIDFKHVVYVPKGLHRSVAHDVRTGEGMGEINARVCMYLCKRLAGFIPPTGKKPVFLK
jgi:hypothetical protein